jgi:hypothetical protein
MNAMLARRRRWIAFALVLAGCGPSLSASSSPSPAAPRGGDAGAGAADAGGPACAPPKGEVVADADDIDGDGVADVITADFYELMVYVRRGDCFVHGGEVKLPGPLAFVHTFEGEISVQTWLMHGDRRVDSYRLVKGHLVQVGEARTIFEGPP